MAAALQTSLYQRVILIDTQVVLETKPLDQLPWSEMGEGPLLLLVCRQVQTEIDAKKSDGRLGRRSRNFNKLLDKFFERQAPVEIVAGPPRVDVALMRNSLIDWAAYDGLDSNDGDDKIVAQALHALVDEPDRIELLSHDLRPRDAAMNAGLPAIKLPEHWLREPEPSTQERDRIKLENELRVLRTEQPSIEVSIEAITPQPWTKVIVSPASDDEARIITAAILQAAPRHERSNIHGFAVFDYDTSFDRRHQEWRENFLYKDLPAMHLGLQKLHAQNRIRVRIENIGPISAEGLSLEVRSGNMTLHSIA